MFLEMMQNVREKGPLIHNIINYVTVNDCAKKGTHGVSTHGVRNAKQLIKRINIK